MEVIDVTNSLHTLSGLATGQRGVVRALSGGHLFRSRAANLGFTAGAEIIVLQNYGHGPMLVSLRGARIALGRAEAAKVIIEGGYQTP